MKYVPLVLASIVMAMLCSCNFEENTPSNNQNPPPDISFLVVAVSPAPNSQSVDIASTISATFSVELDAASVTASSMTVSVGGAPIAGTVSCSGTVATFTPASPLPYSSSVAVTITQDVRDATGRSLSENYTWGFTTAAFSGSFVLITESTGSSIAKVDIATDTLISRTPVGNGPAFIVADKIHRLAYVTLSTDNAVAAINPDTMQVAELRLPSLGAHPVGLALSADGTRLLVTTSGNDGMFSIDDRLDIVSLDPSTWPPVASMLNSVPTGTHPLTPVIDHSGRYAVITVRDVPQVLIMDMATYQVVTTLTNYASDAEPEGADAHPTENIVYVSMHGLSKLEVIDLDQLRDINQVNISSGIDMLAQPSTIHFTPDGTRIFVAAQTSGQLLMFDTTDPKYPVQDMSMVMNIGLQPHFIEWLPGDRAYVANTNNQVGHTTAGSVAVIDDYAGTPSLDRQILTDLQGPLGIAYFEAR